MWDVVGLEGALVFDHLVLSVNQSVQQNYDSRAGRSSAELDTPSMQTLTVAFRIRNKKEANVIWRRLHRMTSHTLHAPPS